MSTKLNLDCLDYIFEYLTPLEWIQISEVCQLWKLAALRRWKRITEITFAECLEMERLKLDEKNPRVILAQDAEKIIISAAPFVKVLKYFTLSRYDKYKYILFGTYCYKMKSFSAENMFKLLTQHSTEIFDVCFDITPKNELLQLLFKNNKIKKLSVFQTFRSVAFYEDIPTFGIEELHIRFMKYDMNVKSCKGYFPNLKKLTLELDCFWITEARQIVPTILPYVVGIKSLILKICIAESLTKKPYKFFRDIFKLSQLEELSIVLDYFDHEIEVESFIKKLVLSCTKLRAVKFHGYCFNENSLHSLMSLPNLKSFDVIMAKEFCSKTLPEMNNLTSCSIRFSCLSTVRMASLCDAINKMPKLENLSIKGLDEEQTLKLAYETILALALQKKEILLIKFERIQGYKKIDIEKKDDCKPVEFCDENFKTLNLKLSHYDENKYFERFKTNVQKKLEGYKTITF